MRQVKMQLKFKLVIYTTLLISLVTSVLSYILVSHERTIFVDELKKRGVSLASSIASNIPYGILTEDKKILDTFIKSTIREKDVAYVILFDKDFKKLAESQTKDILQGYAYPTEKSFVNSPAIKLLSDGITYDITMPIKSQPEAEKTYMESLGLKETGSAEGRIIGFIKLGITLHNINAQMVIARRNIVLSSALLAIFAISLGILFAGRIVRPIKELLNLTKEVARGNLSSEAEILTNDETGELADAFNRMTKQLKASRDKIQSYSMMLEQKVGERTKELKLLYTIGRELSATLETDVIAKSIVELSSEALGFDICAFFISDETTKELMMKAQNGLNEEDVSSLIGFKHGEGISGWVAQRNEELMLGDISEDVRFRHRAKENYIQGSVISMPIRSSAKLLGVLTASRKDTSKAFRTEDFSLIKEITQEAGIALENARLYNELKELYIKTITSLVSAIDAKDHYTKNHSENVSRVAVMIAEAMNLPEKEIENIRLGGQLHDIGKIGVRDEILTKPGKLTPDEWEQMKQHSIKAEEILAPLGFLKAVAPLVRHNHERYDGTGYPDGLKGEGIELGARIIGVADAYDTMASERSYRKPLPMADIVKEFKRSRGTQFDPNVIDTFLSILPNLKV